MIVIKARRTDRVDVDCSPVTNAVTSTFAVDIAVGIGIGVAVAVGVAVGVAINVVVVGGVVEAVTRGVIDPGEERSRLEQAWIAQHVGLEVGAVTRHEQVDELV